MSLQPPSRPDARHDAGGSAPHADGAHHLVQMANDIGNFFRAEERREDAIAAIANHIRKYWTPRMRDKILAHVKAHGTDGLDELPQAALRSLAELPHAKPPHEPHGGDAG
jgi:formate dehydrogenase subunit delta